MEVVSENAGILSQLELLSGGCLKNCAEQCTGIEL